MRHVALAATVVVAHLEGNGVGIRIRACSASQRYGEEVDTLPLSLLEYVGYLVVLIGFGSFRYMLDISVDTVNIVGWA